MFGAFKNAVGLTDKHHGAAALHSVGIQTAETPFTELTIDDERWEIIDNTNVETKTFYMTTDSGKLALVQIIYTNVLNVKTTAQFGAKIFSPDPASKPHLWNSDMLSHFEFPNNKLDFVSEKCSLKISADGKTYKMKSTLNPECTIDLTFTQLAPGFKVGKDGTTYYGKDIKKPSGRMYHKFWPRLQVEGTMTTKDGALDMKGRAMHIHALQGIKPHFAAEKWNFCHFQSPTYSAISMEFTTPPSYDRVKVNVGCIAVDGKILIGNADSTTTHTRTEIDSHSQLPEPKEVTYTWHGKSKDGKDVKAEIVGSVGERMDRIDIMAEVPKFLKGIVAGATGAQPFIYQFGPRTKLTITIDGQSVTEEGRLFAEATFIS